MNSEAASAPAAAQRLSVDDAVAQAFALHQAGRLSDAERLYRAVLQAMPGHFDALHLLGVMYAQNGHVDKGLDLLAQAVTADPQSAQAQASLADALKVAGRCDDALAHCNRALALQPGNAAMHNIRAGILLDMRRFDEAIASCDAALALAPTLADALYHRGVALHAQGQLEAAVANYDRALAIAPDFVPALNNRGNAQKILGHREDAFASIDRAVLLQPGFAQGWTNRGALLRDLGRFDEAVASCDRALALSPDFAEAHNNRGGALNELGRFAEALASCDRALALAPDLPEALLNQGFALLGLERWDDALAGFDRALALRPEFAEALVGRGAVLHQRKEYDEALATFDRALVRKPGLVAALNGRAEVFRARMRYADALAEWERVLAIDPTLPKMHHNRGSVLFELGRYEEAIACYDRAVALQPDFVRALHNRAAALSRLLRFEDALATSERALAIDPEYAEAHHNRGSALSSLMRFEEALRAYDEALARKPDFVASLQNRASVLAYLTRHDEAVRDFERLLVLDPEQPYVHGALFSSRLHGCDWRDYEAMLDKLTSDGEAGKPVSEPFPFVVTTRSARAQRKTAEAWVAAKVPPAAVPLWSGERYAHERIRVAYLSGDLHEHATAYLMAGLFERHDRARFETIGVSFGPDAPDPMRTRLTAAFDRFIDVQRRTDHQIAALLRELEVDIAVDLKGYTYDSRPEIFALRPAPVQVNYLGFPGTSGAPYIDYIVADDLVIPPQDRQWYTEQVVYLPDSYQANDDTREIAERTPTRAEAGLPATGFVFCSFNNSYKITPPVFDVWMRLLREVPGSVLWLLAGNAQAPVNLRREAQARDVDPQRLIFAPRLPTAEHLARQRLADLFLDTLPVNAHTTASDALWAGLPLVTCLGTTFSGRVAGSLLRAAGLPELITSSLAEYEATALALARDADRLAALRARLAAGRDTCALFATDRFRRHLEAAYVAMWERQQRGEPPAAFAVKSVA